MFSYRMVGAAYMENTADHDKLAFRFRVPFLRDRGNRVSLTTHPFYYPAFVYSEALPGLQGAKEYVWLQWKYLHLQTGNGVDRLIWV